jgi:catechol 2,3-dioxygenase-like lactoylglutathione lyase family enzyme
MTSATVKQLVRISRNVSNLRRSVSFYHERLGFRTSGPCFTMSPALVRMLGYPDGIPTIQRLKFGAQELELIEAGPGVRRYPTDSTSADLWFQHFAIRCVDIDTAYRRLYRPDCVSLSPIAISQRAGNATAPIRLPAHSGGASAFKFRDPDGHPLELLQLPGYPDAQPGDPDGIDHSAISVADAQRSIAFYTGILGMTVVSRQTNYGDEQCLLDNLQCDQVDVVALQPSGKVTPHIELLAYRSPVGRSLTTSSTPCDIASDRLVLEVSNVRAIVDSLAVPQRGVVSNCSQASTALLSDPDGHLLLLVEHT